MTSFYTITMVASNQYQFLYSSLPLNALYLSTLVAIRIPWYLRCGSLT